jgi:hypothetical protein
MELSFGMALFFILIRSERVRKLFFAIKNPERQKHPPENEQYASERSDHRKCS